MVRRSKVPARYPRGLARHAKRCLVEAKQLRRKLLNPRIREGYRMGYSDPRHHGSGEDQGCGRLRGATLPAPTWLGVLGLAECE
ncbi:hypothetical protein NDU88_004140 [Pleurodeles waltl]|uniref:Uncharacterized protein n=1 Tax=Pleurodeles waltl TaxID=8319 RepID=A0AAV7UG15_PLEWA|nr:hypothetical protein NDU88_004140 [Pleurodeles waltl]